MDINTAINMLNGDIEINKDNVKDIRLAWRKVHIEKRYDDVKGGPAMRTLVTKLGCTLEDIVLIKEDKFNWE